LGPPDSLTLPDRVLSLVCMIGKRLYRWAWLLAVAAVGLFPASAQVPVPFNGIQAIINDTVISRDQVVGAAQSELAIAGRTATSEQQYLTRRAKILDDQLEQLIDRQLILDEFKEKGYSFPESYVDDQVRERIRRQFGGDRVALTKTLRAENRTFEQFKKEEREGMIIYQMSSRYVRDEIIISPKKRPVKKRSIVCNVCDRSDSGSRRGESSARQIDETMMAAMITWSNCGLAMRSRQKHRSGWRGPK